jgi:hypothetical protein
MRKFIVIMMVLGLVLMAAPMAWAVTFTIYDGSVNASAEFQWEAACGGPGHFLIQSFDSTTLNPGVSLTTVNGVINTTDDRFDDVVAPGGASTTWSFTPQVHGLGGFFNLAGPGGQGTGINVYADGNFVGLISNVLAGQFWGFLSTDTFTNILFIGDGQGGGQETYTLDDLHYCPVPVPSAVWLFGSGLLGLAGLRRKYFR